MEISQIVFYNDNLEKNCNIPFDTNLEFMERIGIECLLNNGGIYTYNNVFVHCPWNGKFIPKDFLYNKGNNNKRFLFIRTENLDTFQKIVFHYKNEQKETLYEIFEKYLNKKDNKTINSIDSDGFISLNMELKNFSLSITYNEMYILCFEKKN